MELNSRIGRKPESAVPAGSASKSRRHRRRAEAFPARREARRRGRDSGGESRSAARAPAPLAPNTQGPRGRVQACPFSVKDLRIIIYKMVKVQLRQCFGRTHIGTKAAVYAPSIKLYATRTARQSLSLRLSRAGEPRRPCLHVEREAAKRASEPRPNELSRDSVGNPKASAIDGFRSMGPTRWSSPTLPHSSMAWIGAASPA